MKASHARIIFISVAFILAVLLITRIIDSTTSGVIFALSLVVLGLASNGFKKK